MSGATCSTLMSEPRVSLAMAAMATAKSRLSWSPSVEACASLDAASLLVTGLTSAEPPAVPDLSAAASAAAELSSTEIDLIEVSAVEVSAACAQAAFMRAKVQGVSGCENSGTCRLCVRLIGNILFAEGGQP